MKMFRKVGATFAVVMGLCVLCMGAGISGIFTQVNSTNGYQVAGAAGGSNEALCGNGTYYATACNVYQAIAANGSTVTGRNTLNLISGTGITVSCVDNSGALRSDCTVATSGFDATLPRFCGVSSFSGGTSGSSVSCSWVTSSSHCDGAWIGTPPGSQVFGFNVSTGSVSTTGSANSSASVSVFCSVD